MSMNPFTLAYNELLFRPLFNLLVGITNILPTHSVGVSTIVVTIIVRLILLPPSLHHARNLQKNQTKMNAVKGDLKKIQKKYQNDQTKKAQATMALYKETGINPAAGCLPILIQLPILIALYRVFLIGMGSETFSFLYPFVAQPETVKLSFLGLDLAQPSMQLALLAGIFQFTHMRLFTSTAPQAPTAGNDQASQMTAAMQKNMAYIFPVMTVFIAIQFPAALALYWVASTIFGIVQQYFFKRFLKISSNIPV